MKGLCILGSTGSVGQNCLRVVTSLPGRFRVVALSAGKNLDVLARQVLEFGPELVVVGASDCVEPLRTRVDALGFRKEVLVVAGELVTRIARERAVEILPIDSEHSAVHQCLRSGLPREVRRIILTGSGGPFLNTPRKAFDGLTPEQALKHPVWKMGGRITIDSSTLMNKGLEVIEAHWLFGLPPSKIDVYIHPESVIHSMIEFIDGTIMAQLSAADMRIPIQYALTYPDRLAVDGGGSLGLDLMTTRDLHFQKPDTKRFPCLEMAREALEKGGAAPCALNAADEIAVEAFVSGRLRFSDIPRVVEKVMADTPTVVLDSLERVLECDRESRQRARGAVADLGGAQRRATA